MNELTYQIFKTRDGKPVFVQTATGKDEAASVRKNLTLVTGETHFVSPVLISGAGVEIPQTMKAAA